MIVIESKMVWQSSLMGGRSPMDPQVLVPGTREGYVRARRK